MFCDVTVSLCRVSERDVQRAVATLKENKVEIPTLSILDTKEEVPRAKASQSLLLSLFSLISGTKVISE